MGAEVVIIIAGCVCGFIFAAVMLQMVSQIKVKPNAKRPEESGTLLATNGDAKVYEIYTMIQDGAKAFMLAEYAICFIFVVIFGILVLVLTAQSGTGSDWTVGALTATAFVLGAMTSMCSGYLGMMVAVYANARTTMSAKQKGPKGWTDAFNTAFRAGGVMGYSLCALALLMLFIILNIFGMVYDATVPADAKILFECVAGYGLGGSCIALFGRVGGGIYTKAADVGADLAGKVVQGLPEDDPRNPATIADNVGDNVGDVAGMGSDLFGSFAEATCAALVISASSAELVAAGWSALMFPLVISGCGIMVCLGTSFIATDFMPVTKEADVETTLKIQLGVTSGLMVALMFPVTHLFLPSSFTIGTATVSPISAWICVSGGLVGGCAIGFITEYYTSHSYTPVREVAQSCETGAATNIIYGLALGYKSCIIPIAIISLNVFVAFTLANMYGVALAALGMLGTLSTCLAIDVYGPICDNAGGIAEMALPEEDEYVRDTTDALDAAGNTTAAIGKGFAIGSAALVSLALFGGFVTRVSENPALAAGDAGLDINVLRPIVFAWLFLGAMLPYWFTALTMKSVGVAANEMVQEVKRQFEENPGILDGTVPADHDRCIKISTDASLREMIMPGILVIMSPITVGTVFGVEGVCGLLVGSLTSGVQLAISQSNTGGAWDNAKKYVEKGCVKVNGVVQGKNTELHKAAVAGDTVGDPLKDTSGPALNILMKLMAIISLVFADFFMSVNCGRGILNIPSDKMVCA
eukprot:SAG11_NODE_893_length_6661_cov_7.017220_1_plen_755_part_00